MGLVFAILLILAGMVVIVWRPDDGKKFGVVIGVLAIIAGIGIIMTYIPTDNYTDWESTSEVSLILPMEENKYVVDSGDEYLYKVATYLDTGERKTEYKSIEKDEYTSIEIVEINGDEVASVSIFTREAKSIFGKSVGAKNMQTKYVFYVPTT